METIFLKNTRELHKEKENLEKKLNVSITIDNHRIAINGSPFNEYESLLVLEAMQFGFSVKRALTLKGEENILRKIPIKNFTRRKNLREVRGRIIGKEGKTKRAIEEISGCHMIINESAVVIIGSAEKIEEATTAITNLIRGSKQSNVYRFLERMNTRRKVLNLIKD